MTDELGDGTFSTSSRCEAVEGLMSSVIKMEMIGPLAG